MLLIKTYLAPSSIHGIGLFSAEDIAIQTPIWRFVPTFDVAYEPAIIESLSDAARTQFLNYAYTSKTSGRFILCSDDMRFINHSDTPNVINVPNNQEEGLDIAARHIKKGEELLYDYNVFVDGPPIS